MSEKLITTEPVELRTIIMGPLAVKGKVKIILLDGSIEIKERCYICRCGKTKNQPYCDGSHAEE